MCDLFKSNVVRYTGMEKTVVKEVYTQFLWEQETWEEEGRPAQDLLV
jgi:hypothetical protein